MHISCSGKLEPCELDHVLRIAVGGIGLGPNPGSASARATRT